MNYTEDQYFCRVCYTECVTGVYSCSADHPTCGQCYTEMKKVGNVSCPSCRRDLTFNEELSNVISEMLVPCKNKANFCDAKVFPGSTTHLSECEYSMIDCPWCDKKTTIRDLATHAEFACDVKFQAFSCSSNITFIKSQANVIITSAIDPKLSIFVRKTDKESLFLCVRSGYRMDQNCVITLDDRKVELHTNTPEDFSEGVEEEAVDIDAKQITLSNVESPYAVKSRHLFVDTDGIIRRGVIIRRGYRFNTATITDGDVTEAIDLSENRIFGLDYNNGRTTEEEAEYVLTLNDDERAEYAMSM